MKKILVVDDEIEICDFVGFQVQHEYCGNSITGRVVRILQLAAKNTDADFVASAAQDLSRYSEYRGVVIDDEKYLSGLLTRTVIARRLR